MGRVHFPLGSVASDALFQALCCSAVCAVGGRREEFCAVCQNTMASFLCLERRCFPPGTFLAIPAKINPLVGQLLSAGPYRSLAQTLGCLLQRAVCPAKALQQAGQPQTCCEEDVRRRPEKLWENCRLTLGPLEYSRSRTGGVFF